MIFDFVVNGCRYKPETKARQRATELRESAGLEEVDRCLGLSFECMSARLRITRYGAEASCCAFARMHGEIGVRARAALPACLAAGEGHY
eukprot:4519571-Pleurochrysis_carterae.AAC.2